VQITLESELWLDVELFESACTFTHGASGKELDESNAELLKNAVQLYRGDLLEGWYQDWCLLERQRLQNLYLVLLDKLLAYSVKHNAFEAGFDYGSTILRYDRARESTHQQLMLLQYKAGNRTGALRQYERCVEALDEEFGVTPQRSTIALYEQMRADRLKEAAIAPLQLTSPIVPSAPEVLVRLKDLCLALGAVQDDLQNDIEALERALGTVRR
jgi:DNA-binding SARP family transcriptional activator